MATLRSRLSFVKRLPLSATQPGSAGSKRAPRLRWLKARPPRKSEPSTRGPIELPNEGAGSSRADEPSVSFGAPEEDEMYIVASEEGLTPEEADDSTEHPTLRRLFCLSLKPNWRPCFSGDVPPRSTLVLFFPEVHEELTKTWRAPYTAHSRLSSSLLTTLDGGAAKGYVNVPQVERAFAVHLCPQNAATWRNLPRLLSKACKLLSVLAAKAYSAAGQAASALHAMAILQVHQAKALKQLHQGGSDPRLMQELRTATDFALRATKVMARSLGQVMSTMVVQECHLWLNLSQMSDADKVRFLDAPISQAGLFYDTVEDFAQQFSPVQKQIEAIKHILPRRESTKPLGARPPSPCRRGRPPTAAKTPAPPPVTTSTEETPLLRHQAGCKEHPQAREAVLTRTTQRWRRLLGGGHLHQSPPFPGEGREGVTSLLPPTFGLVVPNHSQKEQFAQSLGLWPRAGTMSDVLPPQVQTRSLSSREPGAKVGAPPPGCPTGGTSVTVPLIPLARSLEAWLSLSSPSRWLIRTVQLGYSIQFKRRPPRFRGIFFTSVHSDTDASVLRAEIAVLLAKNAIEPVPPAEMKSGLYSPYFIVPKKSGRLRPILDLRVLNQSLHRLPFRMLTVKHIDLKDAPFLQFAFEGRAYQYRVLPFGLALSPRVFTKVAEGALSPLWEMGIRIFNYLDDWLIIAHSRDLLCEHRDLGLQHLSCLGFQVNQEKSRLSPVQSISFFGMELDSVNMSVRLMNEHTQSVLSCLNLFRHRTAVPLKLFQRFLGHMAASAAVTPLGLLRDRFSTGYMAESREAWHRGTFRVGVTPECRRLFSPWSDPAFLRAGVPLGQVSRHVVVNTDASKTAGVPFAMGRQLRPPGQDLNCSGTSIASSCSQCS
ncbi:Gag-Pol polyprotein [Labeo rohita]|uniref:ribonuclease H n=1 Tax=Labeo rohita TaxID=84645 RepID=A0ABQ8LSN0_LABRO|nr:Gag-Pol polyprotein [Labeo rohita]